ncbi:uncharacterized protein LOC110097647 [Dendrobium catenatum]|uniref:uncharacterized protein LOC110097647 n=1 Tax=Dendrobium catenatum TaxID=906689 RepID=UPI0009F3D7C9|nr:uncharacterized protein LOC110097647 [Dendrobium catenatum]XP_028552175.1 uncharacterized protein LOC110097647 [Dendrobium catenatum]XP_028552176.1 uncharacterized protein LOC110097647 [Dendrobium catenatum]XP_028552177.1 uncharacterized protein LOC110097647 [Dendrobium catenatum]XP_028552178.1 uncharacterized protein LOC110097647 [Dendrobium catenatum]
MVEVPWNYVHGWVHMHVEGAFSCAESPDYYSDYFFPLLIQLARGISATDRAQIRLFFFAPLLVASRFRLVYRSPVGGLPSRSLGVSLLDSLTERGRPTLLSRSGFAPIASYLVSMRPGWLCYRRDCSIVLEGYNPNRAVRQFGFVQATPLDGLPALPGVTDHRHLSSLSFSACLEVASMTWAFLLRFGTSSRFYIAHIDAPTGISHLRLLWIRHTFSSFFELGIQRYSRRIKGTGQPKYSSGLRDYTPARTKSYKVQDKRRKRSPEPTYRHDCPAASHGRRPISPSLERGRPRSRTSYEYTASQHAPVDIQDTPQTFPVSPILEAACLDAAHISRGPYEIPHTDEDHTAGSPSGLVVELVVSSPTLSDSTWVVVGDSLGELSLDDQCTCSGSTQLLPRSDTDNTTTELVTHPSLT